MIIDANTHGFHGGYFGPLLKLGGKWAKQVVDTDIENARPRPQLHNAELRLEQMDRFGGAETHTQRPPRQKTDIEGTQEREGS